MGTVQITKSEVDEFAAGADGVASIMDTAKSTVADDLEMKIDGFAVLGALNHASSMWNVKLTNASSRWSSHAEALRTTGEDIEATDGENATFLPEVDDINGGR